MSHKLTKVFVYGTLKRGQSNHSLLEDSKFLGEYSAKDMHIINTNNYPYAYEEEGLQAIGELYEVNKKTMEALDTLEGYPSHYYRKEVTVQPFRHILDESKAEKAWIYYLREPRPYIEILKKQHGTIHDWVPYKWTKGGDK